VFEIIGPLIQMDTKGLTAFTRMTANLVKAMRACRSRSSHRESGVSLAEARARDWANCVGCSEWDLV